MNRMIELAIDPYHPEATEQLEQLVHTESLDYILSQGMDNLELVDVMRALHLQNLKHQRQLESIELIATLPGFTRENFRDTAETIQSLILQAHNSILMLAYRLTDSDIINSLHHFHQQAGTTLRLIVSHEEDLKSIMNNWPSDARPEHVHAAQYIERTDLEMNRGDGQRGYPPLHAKTIVIDRRYCYIGSANFTRGGMMRNVEIGVKVESPQVGNDLWKLAESFPPVLLRQWPW